MLNRNRYRIALVLFIFAEVVNPRFIHACHPGESPAAQLGEVEWAAFRDSYASRSASRVGRIPVLPTNWGGGDPNRRRPEAVLANATSEALNAAWSRDDVQDAVVAVPVKMLRSSHFQFGDGQSNSVASFGDIWRHPRPPVVATLMHLKDESSLVRIRFDRSLNLRAGQVRIQYRLNGQQQSFQLPLRRTAAGDLESEWKPESALGLRSPTQSLVIFVQPSDWRDWFPIQFRHTVMSISDLANHVPASTRTVSGGRPIVDPERVGAQSSSDSMTPFERLIRHSFGVGYNTTPYNPQNIHAEFPNSSGVVTGVGQGWTWVLDRPHAPFKTMYTCFERRRPDREASAKDGGVASGGGWHEVGDNAETILNSLEREPLVVAAGVAQPASGTPSGTFSYQLTDVVTVRFLKPGEAFVTTRGDSPWGYDHGRSSSIRANFHWYYFHQEREVCTEEWIHPCVPHGGNSLGFKCS